LLARLSELIGRELKLKIIEVDRRRNRLILSERLAEREMRAQQREQLLVELEVGQTREGVVSNLCSFGAFVDLGGADGLVHISEISWSRVEDPSEVLGVGEKVQVCVLSLDHESKKIGLSIKRTEKDPWEGIEARYPVGKEVPGIIIKIAPFGAFVRVEDGIEGLAHNSEMTPEGRDVLQEGQELTFRVLSADPQRHRMRLSPTDLEEKLGHLMVENAPEEEFGESDTAPESVVEEE
jgi:small subunit ribosomal protein S1